MLKIIRYGFWLCTATVCGNSLWAQDPVVENGQESATQPGSEYLTSTDTSLPGKQLFLIRHIVLVGNKKTRPEIILREIPFRAGEEYPMQHLVSKFEDARKQLMNTSLFHEVSVTVQNTDMYTVDVVVEVKERWYIFPVPYFKPVDRNLNQWIFEQNTSLSRVNYGIKLMYYNATGRNDKFRFYF